VYPNRERTTWAHPIIVSPPLDHQNPLRTNDMRSLPQISRSKRKRPSPFSMQLIMRNHFLIRYCNSKHMESGIHDRLETNAASRMATVGLFGGTAGCELLGELRYLAYNNACIVCNPTSRINRVQNWTREVSKECSLMRVCNSCGAPSRSSHDELPRLGQFAA
jgi:hypothetical protein